MQLDRLQNEKDHDGISNIVDRIMTIVNRVHVTVIGPGLSRDPSALAIAERVLREIKKLNMPVVLDADGLYMVQMNPDIVKGYRRAILTPNGGEFARLCQVMKIASDNGSVSDSSLCQELSKKLGNVTIIQKGATDVITDGIHTLTCTETGSPRRSGGQGDLLSGSLATFTCWARFYEEKLAGEPPKFTMSEKSADDVNPYLFACLGATTLVRSAAMLPTGNEMRNRRKDRRKAKREEDLSALGESGIRKLRKVRMVGMAGGSVGLPAPPRVGSLTANQDFMDEDDEKLKQQIDKDNEVLRAKFIGNGDSASSTPMDETPHSGQEQDEPSANGEGYRRHAGMPDPPIDELPPPRPLNFKRSCHICGTLFDMLHPFYDQMCLSCATLNYTKRFSAADMTGRVCIVTGARVKIGYAIALKLLRMGGTVIVTTRFPHDAARRYAEEPDSADFKGRLTVYGLDFRDIQMLHHFTAHVRSNFGRLDVIINNAAQTVRKPPAFYEHLLKGEEAVESEVLQKVDVVDVYHVGERYVFGRPALPSTSGSDGLISGAPIGKLTIMGEGGAEEEVTVSTIGGIHHGSSDEVKTEEHQSASSTPLKFTTAATSAANPNSTLLSAASASTNVNASASMSQLAMLEGDKADHQSIAKLFPPGLYDRDDQQIDLRTVNSWNLAMGQISTVEMIECHVINSFAPWVLISELKPLMESTHRPGATPAQAAEETWDKFVVNVSAMEGQFYRNKTIFHPHTNMAKASLNMMTRTAAAGFAEVGIFMTAVDTGWITDENPVQKWGLRENQPPPLDEIDAAMRVLDPVLLGVRGDEKQWGVFLKNYRPTRW
ncbi:hypothetical protein HDU76_010077 [Blyttiomyces sp. JEL0837]|nr:hypothetical protein HDU76_010077 [Blyttiomyces sp. JEL0837]